MFANVARYLNKYIVTTAIPFIEMLINYIQSISL